MATQDENKQNMPDNIKNINSDFNKRVSMNNRPDPSAKRNVGPGGDTGTSGTKR